MGRFAALGRVSHGRHVPFRGQGLSFQSFGRHLVDEEAPFPDPSGRECVLPGQDRGILLPGRAATVLVRAPSVVVPGQQRGTSPSGSARGVSLPRDECEEC